MSYFAQTFCGPIGLRLAAVSGPADILTVFLWFGLAALLALIGWWVALAVRRWAQRDDAVVSFTFQDLREMRARGQINDREFAAMRAALLAQYDLTDDDQESDDDALPPGPDEPAPPGAPDNPVS